VCSGRLPDVGRSLGEGLRDFKMAINTDIFNVDEHEHAPHKEIASNASATAPIHRPIRWSAWVDASDRLWPRSV
jgi:Sec-independent protein translocase protein TatA